MMQYKISFIVGKKGKGTRIVRGSTTSVDLSEM